MISECKMWTQALNRQGYGVTTVDGKYQRAHRVAYCNFAGISLESIKGRVVMHKCDNPSCVNPEHLILGSQLDNMQDKVRKGRQAEGSLIGNSKLSEVQVKEIRQMYVKGSSDYGLRALGELFNVHLSLISLIVRRKVWDHV